MQKLCLQHRCCWVKCQCPLRTHLGCHKWLLHRWTPEFRRWAMLWVCAAQCPGQSSFVPWATISGHWAWTDVSSLAWATWGSCHQQVMPPRSSQHTLLSSAHRRRVWRSFRTLQRGRNSVSAREDFTPCHSSVLGISSTYSCPPKARNTGFPQGISTAGLKQGPAFSFPLSRW